MPEKKETKPKIIVLGTHYPGSDTFREIWAELSKKAEKPYYNLLNNTARLDEETGRIVLRILYKEELEELENEQTHKETNKIWWKKT